MFLRVFNLCNNDVQSEVDKIYNIGKKLQYPTWVLNCCENTAWNRRTFSHKRELGISPAGDKQNPEFNIILPYNECFLGIKKKLASHFSTNIIFSYRNNLRSKIICNNPVNTKNSGIYYIKCKNCFSLYYGQSGKPLPTRISQHKRDVANKVMSNSLTRHVLDTGHEIDWDSGEYIFKSNHFPTRNIVESSIIHRSFHKNINHAYGHAKCDPYMTQVICERVLSDVTDPVVIRSFIWPLTYILLGSPLAMWCFLRFSNFVLLSGWWCFEK